VTTAYVTDFPGSNLNTSTSTITNPDTSTPTINVKVYNADPSESTWQQWIVGLSDVNGKTLSFSVDLTGKETDSVYETTYDGPWRCDTVDGVDTWVKISSYDDSGGFMTFTDTPDVATRYYASVPPHHRLRCLAWMQQLETNYSSLIHDDLIPRVRLAIGAYVCGNGGTYRDDLSRTVSNLPSYGFRVGDDSVVPSGINAKREFVIQCGTHVGEWHGFHMLQGFMDEWLTTSTTKGIAARENINIYCYPLLAKGGSELGFRRNEALNSTTTSADMNREWADADGSILTVKEWQEILDEQHGVFLHNVVGHIDFHDATKLNDTDGNAYWNYYSTQSNLTAISDILIAADSELNAVAVGVTGTTIEYFNVKRNGIACMTIEVRDERNTIARCKEIGANVAKAVAEMYDQSLLDSWDGTNIDYANTVSESFTSGLGSWSTGVTGTAWTRSNAATPTTNTGNDFGVEGSGTYRVFTEAGTSGAPVAEGTVFDLVRENVNLTLYAEMQFSYARFGCTSSTFSVEIDDGSGYVEAWSTSVNMAAVGYRNEGVNLSAKTSTSGKIRFKQTITAGSTRYQNDMDLDFIRLIPWEVSSEASVTPDNMAVVCAEQTTSLTHEYTITPNNAAVVCALATTTLDTATPITPNSLDVTSVVDASTLTHAYTITPDSLVISTTLGATALDVLLIASGLVSDTAVSSSSLSSQYDIAANSMAVTIALASTTLSTGITLDVDSAVIAPVLQVPVVSVDFIPVNSMAVTIALLNGDISAIGLNVSSLQIASAVSDSVATVGFLISPDNLQVIDTLQATTLEPSVPALVIHGVVVSPTISGTLLITGELAVSLARVINLRRGRGKLISVRD